MVDTSYQLASFPGHSKNISFCSHGINWTFLRGYEINLGVAWEPTTSAIDMCLTRESLLEKAWDNHNRLCQLSNLKIIVQNHVSVFTLPSHHCSKVLWFVSGLSPLLNVLSSDLHCLECYG